MGKLLNAPNVEVSRNPATNTVSKLRGTFALPKSVAGDDAGDAVLSFLKENADDLQLNLKQSDLSLIQKAQLTETSVFRYQQAVNKIPVYDSYVLVQADDQAVKQIDLSTVNTAPSNAAADGKISADEAQKIATNNVGRVELRNYKTEPKLMYFKVKSELRLAYEVMVLTQNPVHDWQIFVDAQTGEVLQKTDIVHNLPDGSGMVFDPNPVVTAHNNTFRQPTATVAGGCGYAGTPIATIDAQRVSRTLRDLTFSGDKHKLDGPFVRITNIDSPNTTIPEEASATAFNYSSADDRFGAVNAYYAVDTIQRYIQSLGITTANNRKTNVDPTSTASGWSAFYSPTDKSIHLGIQRPCRPDKAMDSDAVIHEYGHAIQDNQVPGWGTINPVTGRAETRAMGEGFGDILACVFYASFGGGFQRETFEDYAYSFNGANGLRRVDGTKIYPTSWSNEEHNDGEIWSAALWNIYRSIGGDSINLADRNAARDVLLKTVIKSHHLLLPSASMPDAAEAILKTHAEDPIYRGKYTMQMLNSFHDRGILKCSTSANLYIKDSAGDAGAEVTAGNFWNSPDLWITNTDIANSTIANHKNPERGQDNWFHAKVTNKGTQAARAFVVTFNVKTWAGTQFVYPNDFVPFISAGVGFNLAPGASTVIKAKWPASFVPPTGTHSCWVSSVYMPTDTTPAGKKVWLSNNLAQKNLTVVNLIPGDSFVMPFQFANSLIRETQKLRIEVIRPQAFANAPIAITHANVAELSKLFTSFQALPHDAQDGLNTNGHQPLSPIITFKENSQVEMSGGSIHSDEPVTISAVRGTTIQLGTNILTSATIAANTRFLASQAVLRNNEISFAAGQSAGFPVLLQPGQMQTFNLKVGTPAGAKSGDTYDIDLVQRDENDTITGGITISIQVK